MNIKVWIVTLTSLPILALGAAPAMADHGSDAIYDYAKVIRSEPIIRYVKVTTPVRECWIETEY